MAARSPEYLVVVVDAKRKIACGTLALATINAPLYALLAKHVVALENDRVLNKN